MQARCNLIIDSCCDLPAEAVNRSGVYLLKFPYSIGDDTFNDDMYKSTTPHDFFEPMRDKNRTLPTTAQVPVPTFDALFRQVLDEGLPCVYLSFTSALSGSFDTAMLVRDTVMADYPDGQLLIVDTKLASIAEGLLVLGAIEQRERGLDAQELAAWAEEARWFVNSQFMVDDIEALAKGGRMPQGMAMIGAKLDVKPLLGFDLDGGLTLVGMARGHKKAIRSLAEHFQKYGDHQAQSERVIIASADAQRDVDKLRDEMAKQGDNTVFLESSIGPVIGSHVGPGMLACTFWGDDRREGVGVADRIARIVKDSR